MRTVGGVDLSAISTPRQVNQALVYTLPQNYFRIVRTLESGLYSFILTDAGISHLRKVFKAEYHGARSRKRHYIDFEGTFQIIKIPQVVLFYNGKVHYHRILPDFLIPFCRHTVKSLIATNQEIQNTEIIDELPVSESDLLINAVFDHPKRTRYLRLNMSNFLKRIKSALRNLAECRTKLWMTAGEGFEIICKEYLLTEGGSPIRVISYIMDSLWIGGYP